jgi:hypothetical protein
MTFHPPRCNVVHDKMFLLISASATVEYHMCVYRSPAGGSVAGTLSAARRRPPAPAAAAGRTPAQGGGANRRRRRPDAWRRGEEGRRPAAGGRGR